MLAITLPNGRHTDRLAFGCGSIGGSKNYQESRAVLAAAWDAGFRHFDVAPSYGLGEAEAYLGKFLKEVGANDATITSKAGITSPKKSSGVMTLIFPVAKTLLKALPGVRQRLGAKARKRTPRGQFSVEHVSRSLENSLRELSVDHVDIFLLHEFDAASQSEELLRLLEDAKAAGKIGSVGAGSVREKLKNVCTIAPPSWDFFQTSWDLHDRALPRTENGITNCHGVLRYIKKIDELLHSDTLRNDAENAVGVSVASPQNRIDILLSMALVDCNGFVVVQSSQPNRVASLRLDERIQDIKSFGEAANGIFARG